METAMSPEACPDHDGAQPSAPRTARAGTVRLADLLGPMRKLVIDHDGELYSLRLTSRGRLILTK